MVNRRAVRESGTVDRLGVGLVGGGGRRRRLKSRYRRAVRESGTVDRLGVGLVGGGGRRRRLKSRYRCAALRAGGVGTEPLGDAVEVHRLAAAERCNIGLLGEAYDAVPLGRALPCASCCPGLGLLRHQAGLVLLFSAELSVRPREPIRE